MVFSNFMVSLLKDRATWIENEAALLKCTGVREASGQNVGRDTDWSSLWVSWACKFLRKYFIVCVKGFHA